MVLDIVAVLEANASADATDNDEELEGDRSPIVRRPIDLVRGLDQNLDITWHNHIALNSEAWSLSCGILHGRVLDPDDPGRFPLKLHSLALDLSETFIALEINRIVDGVQNEVMEDFSVGPSLPEHRQQIIDPITRLTVVDVEFRGSCEYARRAASIIGNINTRHRLSVCLRVK